MVVRTLGKKKVSHFKSDRLDYIKRYELELQEGFNDIHWDIEKGTLEFEKPVDIDLRP